MSHEMDGDRNRALWGIYWGCVGLILIANWHGCSLSRNLDKIEAHLSKIAARGVVRQSLQAPLPLSAHAEQAAPDPQP